MKFLCLALLTCTFVFQNGALAQNMIPKDIRDAVKEHVDGGYAPGIVVGVYKAGEIEYFAYGHTDAGKKLAVDQNTIFEIGSISKTMTAVLAAHTFSDIHGRDLIVRQMFSAELMQDVTLWEQAGERPIDVKDLLNHTSGFPRMPANFAPADPQNPYVDYNRNKLFESFNGLKLTQGPGISNQYSNYAYGLVTFLLEQASGKTYAELLEDLIAKPFNMQRTVIDESRIDGFNKSIGHVATDRVSDWDFDIMVGAGGVRSTVADMLFYLRAHISAAQAADSETDAMLRALQACMRETFVVEEGVGVGLGWHTRQIGADADKRTAYWHNGQTGGFHSVAAFSPDDDQAIVILCNSVANIDALAFRLFDESVELPKVRKVIQMSAKELSNYIGAYPLHPSFVVTLYMDGDKLMAQAANQPPFRIFPESKTRFFYKVVDADIEFDIDADGNVTGLTLLQNGQELPAKKVVK